MFVLFFCSFQSTKRKIESSMRERVKWQLTQKERRTSRNEMQQYANWRGVFVVSAHQRQGSLAEGAVQQDRGLQDSWHDPAEPETHHWAHHLHGQSHARLAHGGSSSNASDFLIYRSNMDLCNQSCPAVWPARRMDVPSVRLAWQNIYCWILCSNFLVFVLCGPGPHKIGSPSALESQGLDTSFIFPLSSLACLPSIDRGFLFLSVLPAHSTAFFP